MDQQIARLLLLISISIYSTQSYAWSLLKTEPDAPKDYLVYMLGGNNSDSYCRLAALTVYTEDDGKKISNVNFRGNNFHRCKEAIQKGQGMYLDENAWKEQFETTLNSVVREWASSKENIKTVFIKKITASVCDGESMLSRQDQILSRARDRKHQGAMKRELAAVKEDNEKEKKEYQKLAGKPFDQSICTNE